MKKIMTLGVALCVLLSGCASKFEDTQAIAYHSRHGAFCYGDRLYVGTPMRHYDLSCDEGPSLLCSDPLCDHGADCTAYSSGVDIFLLDGGESSAGEVLYTVEQYPDTVMVGETEVPNPKQGYYIQRIDVANHQKSVVLDNIQNRPTNLISYQNTLYYASADGDGIRNLHAIDKDGSNPRLLPNDDGRYLSLIEVTETAVYYSDAIGGFYKADLALANEEKIGQMQVAPPFSDGVSAYVIRNGLYYLDYAQIHELTSDITAIEWTLCRLSLTDGGVSPVAERVSALLSCQGDTLYYRLYNAVYRGRVTIEDKATHSAYEQDVVCEGDGTVMAYDTATGENCAVATNIGYNVADLLAVTEDYLLFDGTRYDYDLTQSYTEPSTSPFYQLDLKTGEILIRDIYDMSTIMRLYH